MKEREAPERFLGAFHLSSVNAIIIYYDEVVKKSMETRSLSQSLIADAKWAFKYSFWVGLEARMLNIQDKKVNYEFESWEDSIATVREKTNKCMMEKKKELGCS